MRQPKWIRHRAQQKGSRPESSGFLAGDWVWLSSPVCPLGSVLALSPLLCYCQNTHFRVFCEPLSESTASLVLCSEGPMGYCRGELSLSCPGGTLPELSHNLYFLIYRQNIWWLMHCTLQYRTNKSFQLYYSSFSPHDIFNTVLMFILSTHNVYRHYINM